MSTPISAIRVSAILRSLRPGWCRGVRPSLRKGRIPPLDLDTKISDRLLEVVDMGQYLAHHEGMMRGEGSFQSIPERGQLGAKAAPSQLRQHLRVSGPAKQSVEHRPSRGTEHAGGHR